MIGIIDVKIQAHNPNFPLDPVFTYKDSPQSFRIRNVPKKIGKWEITKVFVDVSYPDNTTVSQECVLTGGTWIGTVEGCSTSGSSEKGFVVTACGYDEYGTSITGYVLGVGDVFVKDFDGSISPGSNASKMYFYETTPTAPKKGDVCFQNGIMVVWNGTTWEKSFDDSVLNFKRDKTDLNVYDYTAWNISKYQQSNQEPPITYSPPIEFEWKLVTVEGWDTLFLWITKGEVLSDTYLAIDENSQHVYELISTGENTYFVTNSYIPTIDSNKTNITGLLYSGETMECEISRSIVEQTDSLAKVSQIPTSFDRIQDTNQNIINANRTVTYNDSTKWSVSGTFYFNGVLSQIGENEWECVQTRKKVTLEYNDQYWYAVYYQLEEEEIPFWNAVATGLGYNIPSTALEVTISMSGDFGEENWTFTRPVNVTDELVLKSYFDSTVGNINSVLDTINGEVI